MPTKSLSASSKRFRLEYDVISRMIESESKVLDIGCGEGDLLQMLKERNHCLGTGVEVSEEKVYQCISKGLTVFHGDVDEGLADFPDQSFDYVLLTETLQELRRPELVLDEMLRVGKHGILSFPNFAHWQNRIQLCFFGRAPVSRTLPHSWYDTPNIQYVTVRDFLGFCEWKGIAVEEARYLHAWGEIGFWPNLLAETAICKVTYRNRTQAD